MNPVLPVPDSNLENQTKFRRRKKVTVTPKPDFARDLTKLEYFCMHFRIPVSGNPQLDWLIQEVNKREAERAANVQEQASSMLNLFVDTVKDTEH